MAKSFQLDIVTPEKVINEGQVTYLRAPSTDGLFGVEAGHTHAIIALDVGEIKVVKDNETYFLATSGGYADIQPESVMLLVETAERSSENDTDRAKKALDRAEQKKHEAHVDQARTRAEIERARNRLKIVNR